MRVQQDNSPSAHNIFHMVMFFTGWVPPTVPQSPQSILVISAGGVTHTESQSIFKAAKDLHEKSHGLITTMLRPHLH